MNEDKLSKFKLEKRFQDFLSAFNVDMVSKEYISILRQFFYAGAADVLVFWVDPPDGMTPEQCFDELEEIYAEAIAYAKIKVMEHQARKN